MESFEKIHIDPKLLIIAREGAGLKQHEAAQLLRISRQRLSHYERGTYRAYGDTIAKMCCLYRVGIEALVADWPTACNE